MESIELKKLQNFCFVIKDKLGHCSVVHVKSEEMPCDEHHASVLRTAAQMMHRDMLAPVAESRDRLNDSLASEGKAAEGLSLSEVVSRVVANPGTSATPATVKVERLEDDGEAVSFKVTACTPARAGDAQVMERSVQRRRLTATELRLQLNKVLPAPRAPRSPGRPTARRKAQDPAIH